MEERVKQYLNAYLESLSYFDRQRYTSFSVDYFCADENNANLCAELIVKGEKVATCSMKYWYEDGDEPMPCIGHLQVVTDWNGNPRCITETISINECKYSDVGEDFAILEGEGDRSLKWWREAHWDFFATECAEIGIEPSEEMVLVLERFKVVHQ